MGSSCTKYSNKIGGTNDLLNWSTIQPLYKYHWWPMRESPNPYYNNLYCDNGGLDKYDMLFGTNSKEYQKTHYFRDRNSNKIDAKWAGFCDKATTLSCLYQYPKYVIKVKYNGQIIEFTPFDIEMLMIVACDNAIKNNMSIFLGERNTSNNKKSNDSKSNDSNEPYPSDLLSILKIICSINEPFGMDIDNGVSVWNYAYNKVRVTLHTKCPLSHNKLKDGETIYLNFIIGSTYYPEKTQSFWGYIHTKTIKSNMGYNRLKTEGWISEKHPDFVWKKFAKDTSWDGQCIINPEINAAYVYAIYTHSLDDNYHNILEII